MVDKGICHNKCLFYKLIFQFFLKLLGDIGNRIDHTGFKTLPASRVRSGEGLWQPAKDLPLQQRAASSPGNMHLEMKAGNKGALMSYFSCPLFNQIEIKEERITLFLSISRAGMCVEV